jgi:hypothetical protein
MGILKNSLEKSLDVGEDVEAFSLWAFGENYHWCCIIHLRWRWNARHYEDLPIWSHIHLEDYIPYMIRIWRRKKDEQSVKIL